MSFGGLLLITIDIDDEVVINTLIFNNMNLKK